MLLFCVNDKMKHTFKIEFLIFHSAQLLKYRTNILKKVNPRLLKGSQMGHSVKVSLWCVTLLINTRFRFFILEQAIVKLI